jgi:hypothetical protein
VLIGGSGAESLGGSDMSMTDDSDILIGGNTAYDDDQEIASSSASLHGETLSGLHVHPNTSQVRG